MTQLLGLCCFMLEKFLRSIKHQHEPSLYTTGTSTTGCQCLSPLLFLYAIIAGHKKSFFKVFLNYRVWINVQLLVLDVQLELQCAGNYRQKLHTFRSGQVRFLSICVRFFWTETVFFTTFPVLALSSADYRHQHYQFSNLMFCAKHQRGHTQRAVTCVRGVFGRSSRCCFVDRV